MKLDFNFTKSQLKEIVGFALAVTAVLVLMHFLGAKFD